MLFGTLCLTLGSKAVGAITTKIKNSSLPQPGTILTFIACLGVLCGAITDWIGIHAILGFFLAGIMAGNTTEISEHTKETLSQTIHAIFVPLFFASIGIKVDFLGGVEIVALLVFTVVAIFGKFMGAWIGARLAYMSKSDSLSVGIAFTPGGAMEIIVGMLALEIKLITEGVFVAIVFAALLSSVIVGPLLAWSIRRRKAINVAQFLLRDAITVKLEGTTRLEVIEELCSKVAACTESVNEQELIKAVRAREEIMGTGLDKGVAVPHARLTELEKPMVAFGLSKVGIDWDARDGLATHYVFLILTPEREEGMQVQILAAIARGMSQSDALGKLMCTDNEETMFDLLNATLA